MLIQGASDGLVAGKAAQNSLPPSLRGDPGSWGALKTADLRASSKGEFGVFTLNAASQIILL